MSRGFVPTPDALVDVMVSLLFADQPPRVDDSLLDPGCGEGPFLAGVIRWCRRHGHPLPRMVGIEADAARADSARARFADCPSVTIRCEDMLQPSPPGPFRWILGNPPYVALHHLTEAERDGWRARFETARGRFDLYLLFFEQALRMLAPGGRLVLVTPEKYLRVASARPLRALLGSYRIRSLHFVDEDAFAPLVTYPLITAVDAEPPDGLTEVRLRDGTRRTVRLHGDAPWSAALSVATGQEPAPSGGPVLGDLMRRISCGVATGADRVYVVADDELSDDLRPWAHPTLAGREIHRDGTLHPRHHLLAPYDRQGRLVPEDKLGSLRAHLHARQDVLRARTCTRHKPWYAFHDSFPLDDMRRPKLLCKDITAAPLFVLDRAGTIIPRHSVYYLVPHDPTRLEAISDWLHGPQARAWLEAHAQRAAHGFLRLQSHVLRAMPVPESLLSTGPGTLTTFPQRVPA
jgi:SAM-dependent methyltransferase